MFIRLWVCPQYIVKVSQDLTNISHVNVSRLNTSSDTTSRVTFTMYSNTYHIQRDFAMVKCYFYHAQIQFHYVQGDVCV
jgi:hypothetical protein